MGTWLPSKVVGCRQRGYLRDRRLLVFHHRLIPQELDHGRDVLHVWRGPVRLPVEYRGRSDADPIGDFPLGESGDETLATKMFAYGLRCSRPMVSGFGVSVR
jgi:hypothetical protein